MTLDPIHMRLLMDAAAASFAALKSEFDIEDPPEPVPIVTKVAVGEDVQAALTSLMISGGTLVLAPGIHHCDLVIPERQLTDPLITITSDSLQNLPPPGVRIDPSYLPALAQLTSTKVTTNPVKGLNKSRNIAFVNLAIAPPVTKSYTSVAIGGDKTETPTPDLLPSNYIFDRCFLFGDPLLGGHRGIQLHGDGIHVTGCYTQDFWEVGRDAQAVSSWNGGRNLLLDNTYFEAACENVMWGGSDSASVDMITQDVIMRNNVFRKNIAWMALAVKPSIKSLFEVKCIKRLLVDGFLMEFNWPKDWATGVAAMLKCCSGSALEPWAVCEDATMQNGIIRNVGSVFGLVGYGDSGRPSDRMRRTVLRNILAYNINVPGTPYLGHGHGCPIANTPDGLTIDHVSEIKNGHSWMDTWFDSGQTAGTELHFTNNAVCNSSYGYKGPAGVGSIGWISDWQTKQIEGNAFQIGSRSMGTLPPNNAIVSVTDFDASFDPQFRVKDGSVIAGITTTDGKKPGADVDAILAAIPGITI
jgi:hypothetical protein